jgi:hypothetical protein
MSSAYSTEIPTADQVLDTFSSATEENLIDPFRTENVVILPEEGEVWIAGDMHDHRRNFDKLLKSADLGNNPQRHLVLQELIHGEHFDDTGAEESWITLYRAAALKVDFSHQVHFLLANHDLAQIHGRGIMKGSTSVCEAFNKGVKNAFKDRAGRIQVAITEFLLSFPLAVRTPNGVFFCHSLPQDTEMEAFDYSIFGRALTGPDYAKKTGPVYQLIWGRHTTPPFVGQFAEVVGASLIVTGHQPQDTGFGVNGDQHLIIASDHNHGVVLQMDLARPYDMQGLVRGLKKFVAMDV